MCPVVMAASVQEITRFKEYLYNNNIELLFTGDFAVFTVFGVRSIKVPQKCLKSFENLFAWARERVEKELFNIKYIKL